MHQEQQSGNSGSGVKWFLYFFIHATNGFTWIAESVLHFKIGIYYPPMQTRVASLILPYLWLLLWGQKIREQGYPDSLYPLAMLTGWLVWWQLFQWGVSVLSRRSRYSRYTGFSWLSIPFFFVSEVVLKDWIEPAVVCWCGYWWYAANRPFMSLVFVCGVAMFIAGRISALVDMHREQGYTDAFYRPHS